MSNKNKTFQTYMLWLIDMACIITSYILAICIKDIGNWGVKIEDRTKHNMICVVFLLVCVVYSFLADWNRDFAIRGYIKEFLSVFRFMTVMIVASFPITFFLQISPILREYYLKKLSGRLFQTTIMLCGWLLLQRVILWRILFANWQKTREIWDIRL